MKKLLSIGLILCLLFSLSGNLMAEEKNKDNADSGEDSSQKAVMGFYRSRDCMYKVSLYIAKKKAAAIGVLADFHLVGEPIFLARRDFKAEAGYELFCSFSNKLQYLAGKKLNIRQLKSNRICFHKDVPAIPIINGGNLTAVKSYFGDIETLLFILDNIAKKQGATKAELLLRYPYYDKAGNREVLTAGQLLPAKEESKGGYRNERSFVIVYEPIAVGYLTDKKTAFAMTATEYAILQKNGYANFFNRALGGDNPQLMWGLTHRDLPNSIFLEEGWLGVVSRSEVKNRKATAEWTKEIIERVSNKIIAGCGIGMRYLKAEGHNTMKIPTENPLISYDEGTYRTNTEVITSVSVKTKPSSSRIDFLNPNHYGSVTFTIGGEEKVHSVIMPDGGSQLAWVKWKTPPVPGTVHIRIETSPGLYFEDDSTGKDFTAKIVSLNENIPPDPKPTDRPESFGYKERKPPKRPEMRRNTWGEYFATWHEHWVDHGDWVPNYKQDPKTGQMVEDGTRWESDWQDEGWWDWEFRTYEARLAAEIKVLPSDENPTAVRQGAYGDKWEIKSAYGIKTEVKPKFTTNAPSSTHYAKTGNTIAYFPEFQYQSYWRLLKKDAGIFGFPKNKYSHFEAPVHFTPLWFPDGDYVLHTEVMDYWTPAGMLRVNADESILIQGDVYDDWMAVPVEPEP